VRIWWLGACKGPTAKPILARFDLAAEEYLKSGLSITKTPPFARHYDVNGLPVLMPPPPLPNRPREISRRQQMCDAAVLHLSPSGLEKVGSDYRAKIARIAAK